MERITSRKNRIIAELRLLGRETEMRREQGLYLCDGVKLLEEALHAGAEIETVQKARKVFNHKTLIRTIIVVLCSLLVIAAIVCAILFIPSNISASGKVKLTKEQAIEAAHACLVEEVGEEEAGRFFVDYAHRHLRYVGSIFDAIYVYKVEYEDIYGREYEIEVNSNSGYTVIRDIDLG